MAFVPEPIDVCLGFFRVFFVAFLLSSPHVDRPSFLQVVGTHMRRVVCWINCLWGRPPKLLTKSARAYTLQITTK